MRIRPDGISVFFDVLAIVELLFLTTIGGAFFQGSVIAVLLLLAGIALDPLATKGDDEVEDVEGSSFFNILAYSAAAIAVFYGLTVFVPAIPPQYLESFSTVEPPALGFISVNGLFLIQIAVAESEFFHRFLTNLMVSRVGFLGFPAVGAVGAIYHLAVYGDSPNNLLIVFGAFSTLAFIAWHTGRVSPIIIAHVFNNGVSSGLFTLNSIGIPQQVAGITQGNLVLGLFAIGLFCAVKLNLAKQLVEVGRRFVGLHELPASL